MSRGLMGVGTGIKKRAGEKATSVRGVLGGDSLGFMLGWGEVISLTPLFDRTL